MKKLFKPIICFGILIFKFFLKLFSLCWNMIVKISYRRKIVCFCIAFIHVAIIGTIILCLELKGIGITSDQINNSNSFSFNNPATLLSIGGTIVGLSMTVYALMINQLSKPIQNLMSVNSKNNEDSKNNVDYKIIETTNEIISLRFRGFWNTWFILPPLNFPLLSKLFVIINIFFLMLVQSFVGDMRIFYLGILLLLMFWSVFCFIIDVFSIYSDKNFVLAKISKLMIKKINKKLRFILFNKNVFDKFFPVDKRGNFGETFRLENVNYAKMDVVQAIRFIQYASIDNSYWTKRTANSFILNVKRYKSEILLDLFAYNNSCYNLFKHNPKQQKTILTSYRNDIIDFVKSDKFINSCYIDENKNQITKDLSYYSNLIKRMKIDESDKESLMNYVKDIF